MPANASTNGEHATEIDTLISTPERSRKVRRKYFQKNLRFIIAGFVSLLVVVYLGMPARHRYHKATEKKYKPRIQLEQLNNLTQISTGDILHGLQRTSSQTLTPVCTSQLMIMRHCDKDVKRKTANGKIRTTDNRDFFGDGHCSSLGKKRSEYIATLFVDNDEYQDLLDGDADAVTTVDVEGVPPVPIVNVSLDVAKPQFPTPLKLYALNDARYNKNPTKEHKNFREVETITPLADQFHLDIDERFGVNEEGELATDYFKRLSKSVQMNLKAMLNGTDSASLDEDELDIYHLCENGMTVVNWKHSLIPTLSRALGCGGDEGCPKKWRSSDFDTLWVITFQYSLDGSIGASSSGSRRNHKTVGIQASGSMKGNWNITAQLWNEEFDQE